MEFYRETDKLWEFPLQYRSFQQLLKEEEFPVINVYSKKISVFAKKRQWKHTGITD